VGAARELLVIAQHLRRVLLAQRRAQPVEAPGRIRDELLEPNGLYGWAARAERAAIASISSTAWSFAVSSAITDSIRAAARR
jgi:hypothetical protein